MPEDLGSLLDDELEKALSPKNFTTEGDCMFAKGAKIAEYEIMARIGNSGLGELYLARSVVSRKRFAIKVLPPAAVDDAGFPERFAELRSKAPQRVHQNIVHIQKAGCHSDIFDYHYIVMDYIESSLGKPKTLQDLVLDSGKLSEQRTLKTVLQICKALDYAHNNNIASFVHSDLKPSNILFDAGNQLKLSDFDAVSILGRRFIKDIVKHCVNKPSQDEWTDSVPRQDKIQLPSESNMDKTEAFVLLDTPGEFKIGAGLSRFIRSDYVRGMLDAFKSKGKESDEDVEVSFRRQTAKGSPTGLNAINSILDTYDYMSPEQKAGMDPTPQSNIYTVGLIIYRLLTGRKMAGCWDLPSKFGVSKNWDKIVVKCLKMEPEDRYASIAELEADLQQVNVKRSGARRILFAAAALVALAVCGTVLWGSHFNFAMPKFLGKANNTKRIGGAKSVQVAIRSAPAGANFKLFKGAELAAETDTEGPEGLLLELDPGLYTILASMPGKLPVRHEFMVSSDLKELLVCMPSPGEARKYQKSKKAAPEIGFLWEIPDMKIMMIPISSAPQEDRAKLAPSAPFWASSCEINQWQFEKIMRMNTSQFRKGESYPVDRISLAKAIEFCKRLSDVERSAGRLPDGVVYRLPTEAEWEHCARAGSQNKLYSFGDDPRELPKYAWFAGDSEDETHPTASLKPNAWGLYDMHGNVWEYCADILKRNKADDPAQVAFSYLAKGGAWSSDAKELTFSARLQITAIDKQEPSIGFRMLLAPPSESLLLDETATAKK